MSTQTRARHHMVDRRCLLWLFLVSFIHNRTKLFPWRKLHMEFAEQERLLFHFAAAWSAVMNQTRHVSLMANVINEHETYSMQSVYGNANFMQALEHYLWERWRLLNGESLKSEGKSLRKLHKTTFSVLKDWKIIRNLISLGPMTSIETLLNRNVWRKIGTRHEESVSCLCSRTTKRITNYYALKCVGYF